MPSKVDLRPLRHQQNAWEMILLARGQLNRAFRKHNLLPPDRFAPRERDGLSEDLMDNPAMMGLAHAQARFGDAFSDWADNVPASLIRPLLDILLQTWRYGERGTGAPETAILAAYEYLLGRLERSERGRQEPRMGAPD